MISRRLALERLRNKVSSIFFNLASSSNLGNKLLSTRKKRSSRRLKTLNSVVFSSLWAEFFSKKPFLHLKSLLYKMQTSTSFILAKEI